MKSHFLRHRAENLLSLKTSTDTLHDFYLVVTLLGDIVQLKTKIISFQLI